MANGLLYGLDVWRDYQRQTQNMRDERDYAQKTRLDQREAAGLLGGLDEGGILSGVDVSDPATGISMRTPDVAMSDDYMRDLTMKAAGGPLAYFQQQQAARDAASAPYTLGPGDQRRSGSAVIAEAPFAPKAPNLPEGMNADGTAMPGYLDFAKNKAAATRDPNAQPAETPETWTDLDSAAMQSLGYPEGTVGQKSSRGKIETKFEPRKQNQQLSATETKELFEADDAIKAGEMAVQSIDRALTLNDKASSGIGAGAEQLWNRATGWASKDNAQQAADTTAFKTEGLEQALMSLKTIFGAAPTEGERGLLLEIQAAPSMTRLERMALLDRGKVLAMKRLENARTRKSSIEGGSFGRAVGAGKPASSGWSIQKVR